MTGLFLKCADVIKSVNDRKQINVAMRYYNLCFRELDETQIAAIQDQICRHEILSLDENVISMIDSQRKYLKARQRLSWLSDD